MKVIEFYDQVYLPAKHPGDKHRTTVGTYRGEIDKLDRFQRETLGRDSLLDDLSNELICAVMNWLINQSRERTTANKFRTHLNAVWQFAVRRGLIQQRPDNDKLRVDQGDPIAFLPDEKKALLAAARRMPGYVGPVPAGDWWLATLLLCFSFGPRIKALRHLPTANLDLERGEVLLPAHWNKQRREQRRDLFPSGTSLWRSIAPHERGLACVLDDYPFTIRTLTEHFKRVHVLAGLVSKVDDVPEYWLWHCIRKTVASEICAVAGIHVACEVLGHSTIEVTKRYIDPRYTTQIRVRDLLDDPMGVAPDPRPMFSIWRPSAG
jgi:site-specific recombinase XerD